MTSVNALPDDVASLKRLLLARDEELAMARGHVATAAAEAAGLRAKASDDQALIVHLKLQIEKLRRERFGRAPSAVPGCSINSSCSSRSSSLGDRG